MKIAIIGAGNIGSLTAMRLAEGGMGEIVLIDIVPGLAQGKSFDLEDARPILKYNYPIQGTDQIKNIEGCDIIIITAGLTRKPGTTREDLLNKNAQIIKEVCLQIKKLASQAILIVVTNPLDLMTHLALKITGFKPYRVFGMGVSLDAARFANLISQELNIPNTDIETYVIGSHGEGMLPLLRFTKIKGVALEEFLDEQKLAALVKKTVERGTAIVSLLGSGSAFFAPSAAISSLVKIMVKDEKRILGVSAYLNGEYGIKDVCIGVPCRLGKGGVQQVVELDLSKQEKEAFLKSANDLKEQYKNITI